MACLCLAQAGSIALAGPLDRFGVEQLVPTTPGGREWFAQWEKPRAIPAYTLDPLDPSFRNEDGALRIADGVATAPAGLTRLVVLTPKATAEANSPAPWRNVEMTIYVRRGLEAQVLDYQAFYLSARSGERHNDQVPCEGTSYHATARFDGQCGFKKELWHTGGYANLQPQPAPKPWPTVPARQWVGMKFLCRNCDDGKHVSLELFLDAAANGAWQRVSHFIDAGGWRGEKEGCDRAPDAIITEARPAVYFRADQMPVEVKHFSVREIPPLP